jgi:acyl carrier protein
MTDSQDDVEAVVIDLLRTVAELPQDYPVPSDLEIFGPGRRFLDQIQIDSLMFIEVVSQLSDRYGLTLDPLPLEDLTTIRALASFVRSELMRAYESPSPHL